MSKQLQIGFSCLALAAGLFAGGCSSSSSNSPTPAPAVAGNTGTTDTPATGGNGATDPTTGGTTPAPDPTPAPTPTPTSPQPQVPSHHRCAWLNDDVALGTASLIANADFFDAVHPYFWTLTTSGSVTPTSFTDDATIVSTARAHNIKLMPLVYGSDNVQAIRNVISSPSAIAAHVTVLVNLAVSHNYDGIELDYEHLWAASDRAGYTELVKELTAGLHAQGKELSLAVPAIAADNGQNGYDFAALAATGVDVIHLMGYDYHGLGSPHMGPLAPIGWIDAVAARVQSLGVESQFVLGIANYGVGNGWYANSATLVQQCGANYPTTTTHMQSCSFGVYDAGISPHCTTSQGDVWFEDGNSIAEKARTAKAHHLRGVSYYTLGGEAPGLLDGLKAAYPQ
jgi:spore germination protein YaaH